MVLEMIGSMGIWFTGELSFTRGRASNDEPERLSGGRAEPPLASDWRLARLNDQRIRVREGRERQAHFFVLFKSHSELCCL